MFTLQIQVDDTDDLVRVGAICELILSDVGEREISSKDLSMTLDWILAQLETYLEINHYSDVSQFKRLAHQFERMAKIINGN